jgi:hypothetical protein
MDTNTDPEAGATRRMDPLPGEQPAAGAAPPPSAAPGPGGPTQEFSISGHDTLEKIKEMVREGDVRRIIIKARDGRTMAEFPLTVGVVGGAALALLAPPLAALGAILALAGDVQIIVEKHS